MTPEKRNNPLLGNGSPKHISVTSRHAIMDEIFEVVISIRFALTIKGRHVIGSRVQFILP
jgi:hypothetical protein